MSPIKRKNSLKLKPPLSMIFITPYTCHMNPMKETFSYIFNLSYYKFLKYDCQHVCQNVRWQIDKTKKSPRHIVFFCVLSSFLIYESVTHIPLWHSHLALSQGPPKYLKSVRSMLQKKSLVLMATPLKCLLYHEIIILFGVFNLIVKCCVYNTLLYSFLTKSNSLF